MKRFDNAFWSGFISLFNFFPKRNNRHINIKQEIDISKIEDHWQDIGKYLDKAIKNFEKKNLK